MKNSILIISSLLFAVLILVLLWWQWQRFGVVAGQEMVTFAALQEKDQLPQIYAVSRRVLQNEKIAISCLAKASDVDGSDLSKNLYCYDEKGRKLSGNLDTSRPGQFILGWEVKSQITGRRSRKKMIVLVDGRICA